MPPNTEHIGKDVFIPASQWPKYKCPAGFWRGTIINASNTKSKTGESQYKVKIGDDPQTYVWPESQLKEWFNKPAGAKANPATKGKAAAGTSAASPVRKSKAKSTPSRIAISPGKPLSAKKTTATKKAAAPSSSEPRSPAKKRPARMSTGGTGSKHPSSAGPSSAQKPTASEIREDLIAQIEDTIPELSDADLSTLVQIVEEMVNKR